MQGGVGVGVDLAAARGEDPRASLAREGREGLGEAQDTVEVRGCGALGVGEHRADPDAGGEVDERHGAGLGAQDLGDEPAVAPTPRISRFSLFGGRRRRVQRSEELEGSFVDMYSTMMLVWVLWVSLMNLGDSFFTLVHLQAGGIEVNPVADALLRTGRFGFVFAKGALIGCALLVLTLHKNFWLARTGLWISTAAYTALVIYHLTLF